MDRINAYFGYRAVEIIKLVQAPVEAPQAPAGSAPAPSRAPPGPDDPLAAALARLERGVLRDAAARRP
jgi:hypothetical protein